MESDIMISIAVILLSLAAGVLFVPANKYKNATVFLSLLAVLIRIVLVFYLYQNGTDTFGTDGLLYHQEGIKVANQLRSGIPFYSVEYSYTWYTVFTGIIYALFGVNRYIVSFVNILLAYGSALLLLRMALNHRYPFVNAALISLAFLYFPNLFLWTADSRKEALLIFLCILCWYIVQCFIMKGGNEQYPAIRALTSIIAVCFLLWMCTLVRIYMFAPIAAGILVSLFYMYRKGRGRWSILFAAAIVISSVIIFFATVNPLTDHYHAVRFSEEQSDSVAEEVSGKVQTIKSIAAERNVPLSILNVLLQPYPGKVDFEDLHGYEKIEQILNLDMLAWYVCLLLMLTGIYSTVKRRESCFIGVLAYLAVYVVINALVVEDVADTILRYRSVIVGMSLLFIDGDVFKTFFTRLEGIMRFKTGLKTGLGKTSTTNVRH